MSSETRPKKLRGSGGYVIANIGDEQQMKGNLGGPDLFLAPIGRLEEGVISKHFCNTCEKEFEGAPKIQYENPDEVVAENLVLKEKGQYLCSACASTIAEYREFSKQDEQVEIGNAKPLEQQEQAAETAPEPEPQAAPQQAETAPEPQAQAVPPDSAESISTIEGKTVYDENANSVGEARQVGIDSNQSVVLLITKNDGTEASISWNDIKKIGEVILLGAKNPQQTQAGVCASCGFANKEGSKFCEECGDKLPIQ